jgi:hypothetical protein
VFRIAPASMLGCCKDGSNAIAVGWFRSGVFKDEAISAKSIFFNHLKIILDSKGHAYVSHEHTKSKEPGESRGARTLCNLNKNVMSLARLNQDNGDYFYLAPENPPSNESAIPRNLVVV